MIETKRISHFVRLLTLAYLIGGIGAIGLSLLNNYNKEHFGVVFLIGSILSIIFLYKRISGNEENERVLNSSRIFKLTAILYFVFAITAICFSFFLREGYKLPLEYFIIITLMGVIISHQIFYSRNLTRNRNGIIFIEILVLSILTTLSLILLFESPQGNDSSFHINFINEIIENGAIASGSHYENHPLYHLLFAVNYFIPGIEGYKALEIIAGLSQLALLPFIYLTANIFFTRKAALLSTLVASVCPYLLFSRYIYIPNFFATIFFAMIIFLILSFLDERSRAFPLFFIILLALIAIHPIAPAILLVFLLITFVVAKILNFKNVSSRYAIAIIVSIITLLWWMMPISDGTDLFSNLVYSIQNALETIDFTEIERATLAPYYSYSEIFLNDFGFTMLLLMGVIGAFLSLSAQSSSSHFAQTKRKEMTSILAICLILLLPIPFILGIIYPNSLPDRWFPFLEILISIMSGIALITIFHGLRKRSLGILPLFIVAIIIFFAISTPMVNPDTELYSRSLSSRSGLTTSEITAANLIDELSPNELRGNSKYLHFIGREYMDSPYFISPDIPSTYESGYIVIRDYDMKKGFTIPLFGAEGQLMKLIYPTTEFNESMIQANHLYSNGNVILLSR